MKDRQRKFDRENKRIRAQMSGGRMILFLFCLAVLMAGCGISGGDQFTKIDDKYLEESADPQEERSDADSGQQTAVPSDSGEGTSPGGTEEKREDTVSSKRDSASEREENVSQNNKNKSSASKTTAEPKKNSIKKPSKKTADEVKDSPSDSDLDKAAPKEEKKDGDKINCFLSVDCKTILSNMSRLKENKKEFVPKDGVIVKKTKVTIKQGSRVYDVLYQVCREKKIHLEAAFTPVYKTYYVEGINQLYEFDCGELSGWNYTVNGVQPNYGASKCQVEEGDVIAWRYTCERGKDL